MSQLHLHSVAGAVGAAAGPVLPCCKHFLLHPILLRISSGVSPTHIQNKLHTRSEQAPHTFSTSSTHSEQAPESAPAAQPLVSNCNPHFIVGIGSGECHLDQRRECGVEHIIRVPARVHIHRLQGISGRGCAKSASCSQLVQFDFIENRWLFYASPFCDGASDDWLPFWVCWLPSWAFGDCWPPSWASSSRSI